MLVLWVGKRLCWGGKAPVGFGLDTYYVGIPPKLDRNSVSYKLNRLSVMGQKNLRGIEIDPDYTLIPNYCSEGSPRELLGEVEKRIMSRDPLKNLYIENIVKLLQLDTSVYPNRKGCVDKLNIALLTVSAKIRALALFLTLGGRIKKDEKD